MQAPEGPKRCRAVKGAKLTYVAPLDQSPQFNIPTPILSGGWRFAVWSDGVQALSGLIHLQ